VNRLGKAILIASITPLVAAGTALAHAELASTSPKTGATLARVPARVTATFTGHLRSGTITVKDSRGRTVSIGTRGRDPANVKRLRVPLKRGLSSDRYTVRWTIVAADGDEQVGSFRFRVQ
jgi:methionine-rich copper-binding protein CopC